MGSRSKGYVFDSYLQEFVHRTKLGEPYRTQQRKNLPKPPKFLIVPTPAHISRKNRVKAS